MSNEPNPTPGAALSASAQRVQDAIRAAGFEDLRVFELEIPVRTATDAARAVGCEVGQIAKSLVFRGRKSGRGVLVIASGSNRVSEYIVADHVGEDVKMADPDFVRETTGYAIGGVPPVGHRTPMVTLIDPGLMDWPVIWAAAGHPNALFELTPEVLVKLSGGEVAVVV